MEFFPGQILNGDAPPFTFSIQGPHKPRTSITRTNPSRFFLPKNHLKFCIVSSLLLLFGTILPQAIWRRCLRSLLELWLDGGVVSQSPGYSFFYDLQEKIDVSVLVFLFILLLFKRELIRTGQFTGVLPIFVTLWISTVNTLLIDNVLSFCNENCHNPFRKVPIHLLSLLMDINLTLLLLPLHMFQFAREQVVLIENMVKKMMAASFAVVMFSYVMVIMLVIGII